MREAFEKAIRENPDDLAGHAAYADWLSKQGDPRGEFMQVQLAVEEEGRPAAERRPLKRRERALLKAHQREWLGPLAPWLLDDPETLDVDTGGQRGNYDYRFARGFLATLHVHSFFVPVARALRDAPQTAFLRELVIEYIADSEEGPEYEPGDDVPTLEEDNIQFGSVFPLLGPAGVRVPAPPPRRDGGRHGRLREEPLRRAESHVLQPGCRPGGENAAPGGAAPAV
jgi:uncharacterized protein (TIGR02996 family)